MAIRNKFLEIRLKLGYKNQYDFADYLEVNRSQYSKYEKNIRQPSIEVFYKISKKLNITINDLLE